VDQAGFELVILLLQHHEKLEYRTASPCPNGKLCFEKLLTSSKLIILFMSTESPTTWKLGSEDHAYILIHLHY
jgi:hypothetical protein